VKTDLNQLPETEQGLSGHAMDAVLGARIRHLRKARRLSIKEVAERTGFSIGFVSQIERGLSSASVRVLTSMADALNVSISSLFDEVTEGNAAEVDQVVVRVAARKKLTFWETGLSKQLLTPSSTDSHLHVYLVVIEPDGHTGDTPYTHEGEEAGLVLEGSMELTVDERSFVLGEGDSFRFSSRRPHRFRSVGRRMARVLWVNAKTSEVMQAASRLDRP
jgi:transcriptional regulator with XRE-family HTH domain